MFERTPARTTARRARWSFLVVAVLCTTLAGVLVACQSVPPASPSSVSSTSPPHEAAERDRQRALGEAPLGLEDRRREKTRDGWVPEGVTVFDEELPAVANLDSDLLGAVREAATDAADDGIELYVNSGWRSAEYQEQLLRQAVSEYGSKEEAARWVATAETSPHVSGDAIDIGDEDATSWLVDHGAAYGLCQIYENEPWHYELRADADDDGCPTMYADPTHDPRMQQ